jgi:hypothetical protein
MSAELASLSVLVLGFVAAIALVVAGAGRVVRDAKRLQRHVESYRSLPLGKTIELTQARVAYAARRADTIPSLIARAHAAITQIEEARVRLTNNASSVALWVRVAGSILGGRPKSQDS